MALPALSARTLRGWLYGCALVCIVVGAFALADRALGTTLWPDEATHWGTFLVLVSVFVQLLPDRAEVERWRVMAVGCLSIGLVSLLALAYTAPESPLNVVPLVSLVAGGIVASRGLYREWANPHP